MIFYLKEKLKTKEKNSVFYERQNYFFSWFGCLVFLTVSFLVLLIFVGCDWTTKLSREQISLREAERAARSGEIRWRQLLLSESNEIVSSPDMISWIIIVFAFLVEIRWKSSPRKENLSSRENILVRRFLLLSNQTRLMWLDNDGLIESSIDSIKRYIELMVHKSRISVSMLLHLTNYQQLRQKTENDNDRQRTRRISEKKGRLFASSSDQWHDKVTQRTRNNDTCLRAVAHRK